MPCVSCEEKEREIIHERQSLSDRKKLLQQEHERLLDAQTTHNEREDHILSKFQELSRKEKEIEASRVNVDEKFKALNEEKSNLDLTVVSLSKREQVCKISFHFLFSNMVLTYVHVFLAGNYIKYDSSIECTQAVIEREALLQKKEQDLLISQGKLASKESVSYLV